MTVTKLIRPSGEIRCQQVPVPLFMLQIYNKIGHAHWLKFSEIFSISCNASLTRFT